MLREQREIFNKLANIFLDGVNITYLKKKLKCGIEYSPQERWVGHTSYFLTIQTQPNQNQQQELSLCMRGYITAGTGILTLIRVRRDVGADFLNTDEKCNETLAWMLKEFTWELEYMYSGEDLEASIFYNEED